MQERGGETGQGGPKTHKTELGPRAWDWLQLQLSVLLLLLLASLPAQHLRGITYPPPKNNLNTKNSQNRQSCSLNITLKWTAGVHSPEIMGCHIWVCSSANQDFLSYRNSSQYRTALPKQGLEDSDTLQYTISNTVESASSAPPKNQRHNSTMP